MTDDNKAAQMLERILKPMERLLETTQDMFILQALESGMTVRTVKSLLSAHGPHHKGLKTSTQEEQQKGGQEGR